MTETLNGIIQSLNGVLGGISLVTFVGVIMWVGYKLAFAKAAWQDLIPVIVGGLLVSGATGLAELVVGDVA